MDRCGANLQIMDMAEQASEAVGSLELETSAWLEADLARLDETWAAAQAAEFTAETTCPFYRAAHNLAGMAAIYGLKATGRIAHSLCRLINNDRDIPDAALIDTYVKACRRLSE